MIGKSKVFTTVHRVLIGCSLLAGSAIPACET